MSRNRMVLAWAAAALLSGSAVASAQQAREEEPRDEAASAENDARPHVKVLQHPYDLASFYRSEGPRYRFFSYDSSGYDERYPIAGYYTQHPPNRYGYSQFWSSGYAGRYEGRGARGGYSGGYPGYYMRRIGQNGDLYLLAPTILAPVGPLMGGYWEGR